MTMNLKNLSLTAEAIANGNLQKTVVVHSNKAILAAPLQR